MTVEWTQYGRFGKTVELYDLAEPNCDGESRVHERFFNGLLAWASVWCAETTTSMGRGRFGSVDQA